MKIFPLVITALMGCLTAMYAPVIVVAVLVIGLCLAVPAIPFIRMFLTANLASTATTGEEIKVPLFTLYCFVFMIGIGIACLIRFEVAGNSLKEFLLP